MMIELFPSYPLEAFFDAEQQEGQPAPNPTMMATLTKANLIFGRDVTTGSQFLVFGRELLQAIVQSGEIRPVSGLVIEIGKEGGPPELESLCELVRAVKGRDDYQVGETFMEE